MNLNKVFHRVQFEKQVQEILDKYQISRSKFQDLSKLDLMTRTNTRIWYCYSLELRIHYPQLKYIFKRNFYSLKDLKSSLQRKFNYYLDYQSECSTIFVQVQRKEISQLDILGSYYAEYKTNYVCSIRENGESKLQILSQQELRQLVTKEKYQTNKEEEFYKKLEKNQIQQFTYQM